MEKQALLERRRDPATPTTTQPVITVRVLCSRISLNRASWSPMRSRCAQVHDWAWVTDWIPGHRPGPESQLTFCLSLGGMGPYGASNIKNFRNIWPDLINNMLRHSMK